LPSLERIVGKENVRTITLQTTAEDFSYYGQDIPSLFFWVGITPPDRDAATAPFNHSPLFYLDEAGLSVGARAMLAVAVDYLQRQDSSLGRSLFRPGPGAESRPARTASSGSAAR
jgi:amidohydrolase